MTNKKSSKPIMRDTTLDDTRRRSKSAPWYARRSAIMSYAAGILADNPWLDSMVSQGEEGLLVHLVTPSTPGRLRYALDVSVAPSKPERVRTVAYCVPGYPRAVHEDGSWRVARAAMHRMVSRPEEVVDLVRSYADEAEIAESETKEK
nr:MAG TPA: hypothetical protein [Caudoviricetes sp.]